ncbi:hypothetical protein NDN08_004787 [Rhodosorus marinus]|uniref:Uncharacterized protein n=1 Tax=Rhodosorus marinus TaxID=101924 RepID=A0AAV8USV1_9RHOD|nr:hypothetical protein NDN08_004787 [Rhodosorus marinus]
MASCFCEVTLLGRVGFRNRRSSCKSRKERTYGLLPVFNSTGKGDDVEDDDFWSRMDDSDDVDDDDVLRRLEEHRRSFGFKDFVRPPKDDSELLDEDVEDEVEDLRRMGFVPMLWEENFSEEELLYMRTPDLPFDPINRRPYPKVEDPPPLSVDDVHVVPIDRVDLSKIRPLKWSDLEKSPQQKMEAAAKELAELDSRETIEWTGLDEKPNRDDVAEWREAEEKRGGRAGTRKQIFPFNTNLDEGEEDGSNEASVVVDPIVQGEVLPSKLQGLWMGQVLEFDMLGARTGRSWYSEHCFETEAEIWDSLSLKPHALSSSMVKDLPAIHIVTTESLAGREDDVKVQSFRDKMEALIQLPRSTVVFADGSYSAGSFRKTESESFFCEFLFNEHEFTVRLNVSSSSGEKGFNSVLVSVQRTSNTTLATDVVESSTLGIEQLLGSWSGEAISCVPAAIHRSTTRIKSRGVWHKEKFPEELVSNAIASVKTVDPSVKQSKKRKKSNSANVKRAKKRDRERISKCDLIESIRLGSFESVLAGKVGEDGRSIEFPLLENGLGGRRVVFLPGNLIIDVPMNLLRREPWFIVTTYMPLDNPNTRIRIFRSYNSDGEFVGSARSQETREEDHDPLPE